MSIISKETWDKFTQEEKQKIREIYKATKEEEHRSSRERNAVLSLMVDRYEDLFDRENLQPQLTYEDVARELFKEGAWQFMDGYMGSEEGEFEENANETFAMNMTSKKQAEKLLAINRLLNVAKFLNKDWKPDWEDREEEKWTLQIYHNKIDYTTEYSGNGSLVYFESMNLAQQAVTILGEDTVRLALTTDF